MCEDIPDICALNLRLCCRIETFSILGKQSFLETNDSNEKHQNYILLTYQKNEFCKYEMFSIQKQLDKNCGLQIVTETEEQTHSALSYIAKPAVLPSDFSL